jgi:hypothetical protein
MCVVSLRLHHPSQRRSRLSGAIANSARSCGTAPPHEIKGSRYARSDARCNGPAPSSVLRRQSARSEQFRPVCWTLVERRSTDARACPDQYQHARELGERPRMGDLHSDVLRLGRGVGESNRRHASGGVEPRFPDRYPDADALERAPSVNHSRTLYRWLRSGRLRFDGRVQQNVVALPAVALSCHREEDHCPPTPNAQRSPSRCF